jgi:hypothetical protein
MDMLNDLIKKYQNKHQYETNPLVKGLYADMVSDLRQLREETDYDAKKSRHELETAREGLVKELEVMERRDVLENLKRDDALCKRCGLPSEKMLKTAGGGSVCLKCR